jgi:hypothetical protein
MVNIKGATHLADTKKNSDFCLNLFPALPNDLSLQFVLPSDGLRSTLILDQDHRGRLPAPIDFPFFDGDRLFLNFVSGDKLVPELIESEIKLSPFITADEVGGHTLFGRAGMDYLKAVDDE